MNDQHAPADSRIDHPWSRAVRSFFGHEDSAVGFGATPTQTELPSGYVLENHDWPSEVAGPAVSTPDIFKVLDVFDSVYDDGMRGLAES